MARPVEDSKRVRELKASTLQNVPIQQVESSSPASQASTPDFEDTIISTLRAKGKSWTDIVARLNEHRICNQEAPTWTEAAVYSRFILCSSAAPTPAKEVGFEPRDYAHLRNAGNGREGTSKVGKKRVKDFHNATELSANIRKPATIERVDGEREVREEQKRGEKSKARAKGKGKGKDENRRKGGEEEEFVKVDDRMVDILMHAVAKVERNLWVFVADEVERESGKYIEPRELEKVFREI